MESQNKWPLPLTQTVESQDKRQKLIKYMYKCASKPIRLYYIRIHWLLRAENNHWNMCKVTPDTHTPVYTKHAPWRQRSIHRLMRNMLCSKIIRGRPGDLNQWSPTLTQTAYFQDKLRRRARETIEICTKVTSDIRFYSKAVWGGPGALNQWPPTLTQTVYFKDKLRRRAPETIEI